MNLLKCIPFILLIGLISCSKEDSNIDEFLGHWELSNFKWVDCENSGIDNSIDLAVPTGGCFFDGCYNAEIFEDNQMIISYATDMDAKSQDNQITYEYDASANSIRFTNEEFEGSNTIILKNGELVFSTLEDGCDTEFRMRKI